jgi:hypothetical protein
MVVPNQVAGLHYTATPAAELADVPDAALCEPTQVPHKRTEMDTRQRNHDTWILRDWLVHWGSATPVCYVVE